MANRRTQRLNELIRRDISARLLADVKDPRVGFVTVIRAELHHSISTAEVYVTVFEDDKKESTVKALNKMKGFFQKDLSKTLGTRLTPVLTFKLDQAAGTAYGLDSLITKARESDGNLTEQEYSDEASSEESLEEDRSEEVVSSGDDSSESSSGDVMSSSSEADASETPSDADAPEDESK